MPRSARPACSRTASRKSGGIVSGLHIGVKQEAWWQPLAGCPAGKWQAAKCLVRVGLIGPRRGTRARKAEVWPVIRTETQENKKGSQLPKLGHKVGHSLRKKVQFCIRSLTGTGSQVNPPGASGLLNSYISD